MARQELEGMGLSEFARLCSEIGSHSSQNHKQDVVVEVLENHPEDAERFVRFLTGQRFDDPELKTHVGGKTVRKVASDVYGVSRERVDGLREELGKTSEAVGAACEEADSRQSDFTYQDANLEYVGELVAELPHADGDKDREAICKHLLSLCCTRDQARWTSYCILGDLSLGCGSGIVRKAMVEVFDVTREELDLAYAIVGSLPQLVGMCVRGDDLPDGPTVGEPFKPMLASSGSISGTDEYYVGQPKFDGARVLIHSDGEEIRVFSRNRKEVTDALPEITESFEPSEEFILDGEAVAYDPETGDPLPFEKILTRFRRKKNIEKHREEVEVRTWIFDCLVDRGRGIWNLSMYERKATASEVLVRTCTGIGNLVGLVKDWSDVERAYEYAVNNGHEGAIAKDIRAPYKFNSRSGAWRKIKPSETLDLRVADTSRGNGKFSDMLGTVYLETSEGEPVGRCGIGFSDDFREKHKDGSDLVGEVIEIEAEELQHTSGGYAIRFPRFERVRDDKDEPDSLDRVKEVLRYES